MGETKVGVKRHCIQPEELLDLLKTVAPTIWVSAGDTEHVYIENLDQDKAIAKVVPILAATHISGVRQTGKCSCASYKKYRLII